MFSFKTTVKSGLVALAILIAMLSIRIASADDFTIGTIIPTPTHSFSVAYLAEPVETITYNPVTRICEYWSVTPLGDWYYGYIANPIVTYELTFWAGETVVVGCTAR